MDCEKIPLSIIIVGIGNENFAQMEELDSGDDAFNIKDGKIYRDVVQFIEFNKY